jgi:hypothetical protein
MLVQIGGNLYALVEGQPLPISAGQTLRVFFTFGYKVAETTTVPIWASLYTGHWLPGVEINRVERAQTKAFITLDRAIEWQTYEGQIDIPVGNVSPGVYGLIVELPGFKDAEATIDDCIEALAAPGIMDWMGPMMMLVMLGMMAPLMEGMEA